MRRDEREIIGLDGIYDVLNRCDTVSIAMNGGDGYPYVIPMTFGCEMKDGKIVIYLHSAKAGRKWDILRQDPKVCVEAHLYYQVAKRDNGSITAIYESVIGTGDVEILTEREDKVAALKCMLEHYKESGFPVTSCKGLPHVEVFRIILNEVTGKHNL